MEPAHVTVGNGPNKGVKLLYVVEKEDNVPLDERRAKRGREAV